MSALLRCEPLTIEGSNDPMSVGVVRGRQVGVGLGFDAAGAYVFGVGALLRLKLGLVGGEVAVCHSTLGVDIVAVGATPCGERLRVEISADDDNALRNVPLARLLSAAMPVIERVWQYVAIDHDGLELEVVFARVPRDANSLNLHGVSPDKNADVSAMRGPASDEQKARAAE